MGNEEKNVNQAADKERVAAAARRFQQGDESAFNDIYAETLIGFSEQAQEWFPDDPVYQDALQIAYAEIAAGPKEQDAGDADALYAWMEGVLHGVLDAVQKQKEREVPEDLEEFLKIGKSIISTKDIEDFEKKKKEDEEKREEAEIMNLH